MAVASTKELLRQVIDDLPDDCTVEDAQYRLYVLDAVQQGRDDVAAGRTVSHDDLAADLGRRWGKR